MSITVIENLSNEIFYKVFDYFDGCEIYQGFSSLNHPFEQLINSSSLLFKVQDCYSQPKQVFMNNYQQIFLRNKNQILSSFYRLESFILTSIEIDELNSLLRTLTCLPRLFALRMDTDSDLP